MLIRQWAVAGVAAGLCLAAAPAPRLLPAPPPARPLASSPAADGPADPEADPVRFLEQARDRVRAGVKGYRAVLHKRERIRGKLHGAEVVHISVRARPYAVRLRWYSGGRDVLGSPVEGLVYSAGTNNGRLTVWRPSATLSFLRYLDVLPTDDAARQAARYAVTEASLAHAAERTARVWRAAAEAGTLKYDYAGVRRDAAVGGRPCHVFTRYSDPPRVDSFLLDEPEPSAADHPADAAASVSVWVDVETGLQLGSELKRADGELVGAYFFTDLELNPAFRADEFVREGLK